VRLALALVLVATLAATAAAQPGDTADSAELLSAAENSIAAGEYDRAIELAGSVVSAEAAAKADFAEAHRLLGLAHYFRGDTATAEAEFLAYLKLDLDGRLDPAVVPPEAVAFFEDVRARHAVELRKLRPRQRRFMWLNLLPPGGQIQNRQYTKAWVLGGVEVALAATHLTTFFVLRSWCDNPDNTCVDGGTDIPDKARKWRTVNYLSGAALIGVYVYGVIDGFRGFRRTSRERAQPVVTATPVEGGGIVVGTSLSF
jgi:hypothetical protein